MRAVQGIIRKGEVVGFRLFKEAAEEWVDSFEEFGGYVRDGLIYLSNEYSLNEKYSRLVLHPLHVPDLVMERDKAIRGW